MRYKCIIFFLLQTIFFQCVYAQVDTLQTKVPKSVVFEENPLYDCLVNYLLDHPTIFTIDSNRKVIPFTKAELKERYEGTGIASVNLKTDSIYFDKSGTGIYKFGYMDIAEPKWLYLKYNDYIEFIDLNKKSFKLSKVLNRIHRFFRKNPSFTEKEKVKMLKRAMDVIYNNLYEEYSY